MLQHVLLLLFSICSYLVTMHIPQKRSNPGDDAKELGWCAYGPLESADMQDISDRPKKMEDPPKCLFSFIVTCNEDLEMKLCPSQEVSSTHIQVS